MPRDSASEVDMDVLIKVWTTFPLVLFYEVHSTRKLKIMANYTVIDV
jgi:hypothetical protein